LPGPRPPRHGGKKFALGVRIRYTRRMRSWFRWAARFAAGVVVVLSAAGCRLASEPTPLRLAVMSYNIRVGIGGGERHNDPSRVNLEPVARLIEAHHPDLVGLQEVDRFRKRTGGMDQAAWLGARLKMRVAYEPAFSVAGEGGRPEYYGVALLSRHAMGPSSALKLFKPDYRASHPEYPDYYSEQRVLLYAPVQVGGKTLHVFVTHLGLTADQRAKQIAQIAEFTARYTGPKILMGDFNAEPHEPAFAALRRDFQDALAAAGVRAEARRSFPAGLNPRTAIDYIFVSREFRVRNARVIRDATLASDHNPVMAELELLRR
jgi:endonuclease/exonuclease/phosphatase family metal-dependent hydrolase